MTGRVLVLGEAPSRSSVASAPLSGRGGARLAALAGVAPAELPARFDLANLLPAWPGPGSGSGSAFPAAEARRAAAALDLAGRRVVALGGRVAAALGARGARFEVVEARGATVLLFPHPSGASRFWNDPASVERAGVALRAFVGGSSPASADRTRPEGRWTFDGEVAASFDEMLERSVPDYRGMRAAVAAVARRFARPGAWVVDLGCSRGESIADLLDLSSSGVRFVGCEVSAPMLAAARLRFDGADVELLDLDLRNGYPHRPTSATLCVLTLQFVPIEHRQRVLRDACRNTLPGGALLLVEKVLGADADLDATLVDLHHRRKIANGYSAEDVDRKRLALEGVLVPVTARWNEELLRGAGFDVVDCFWRCLNFAAWVAVRRA